VNARGTAPSTDGAGGSPSRLSTLRGDLAGGLACAILTLPGSAGLGVLALSPLGERYVPHGILAGLYPAILLPLVALLLGARSTMMYSARSVLAILIAAVALNSLTGTGGVVDVGDVPRTEAVLFLVVFAAGLLQMSFGAFGLGNLVRYIPAPVMAGFQNAGAILIFFGQIDPMLGFDRHVPIFELSRHLASVQPWTLVVGLVTAAAMWNAGRVARALPPTAVGLIVGSAAFYAVAALGHRQELGPVIGTVPSGIPLPTQLAGFAGVLSGPDRWRLLAVVISGALSVAIIASLDGLLSAKTADEATGERTEGNRALFHLGVGNMVSACFGGITGGVNMVGTVASYRAGARTAAAVLACALTILLAVLLLPPVIALIPRVVIAGMLAVISIQLVDGWTVQIIRKMLSGQVVHWRRMALDLFVIALVAGVAIAVNLVAAVGIGVVVAILSFLFRMSQSVIRRAYPGSAMQSRRTLEPRLMEVLSVHGERILVLELQGPLFFGTAEDLARQIDASAARDVTHVILDLKRINEVDSTGARILLQIHDRLRKSGRHLILSHLEREGSAASVLDDMGVIAAVTEDNIFEDTDRALEWAEDHLIRAHGAGAETAAERRLEEMDALEGLDARECAVLNELVARRHFTAGDVVFREGDLGRELFLIARGTASVKLQLAGGARVNRLATFSAGTMFGELALLDPGPRSASVEADQELVCYVVTEELLERLRQEHPAIAIKLMSNLGRELSRRLRRANRTIYQLEG
jgi:anti-anti-sigma factor